MEAEARRRAYALLAELVSHGPGPSNHEAAAASPLLAAALDSYPALDEAAADHQHALGFAVPPYEGAFLDPEGRVGGVAAGRVHETYRAVGFEPDLTGDDPEHLATELRALASLSAREVDGMARGEEEAVARARRDAARLLDAHLLRWLPVLAATVRRLERPLPTALVDQVEDLLRLHRADLPAGSDGEVEPFVLPAVPDLLSDPSTGLGDVAARLSTPALSGLFVSRDDVTRIGRSLGVPRGFGERRVMLHNLLKGAVHADRFGALLDALLALVGGAGSELAAPRWAEPPYDALVAPWRERLADTRVLLERMRDAAPLQPDDVGGSGART